MADQSREIEDKYDVGADFSLPDLVGGAVSLAGAAIIIFGPRG